ncbi:MerR family transcriptional regulator (plasmid) [Bosea sp. F3-2]|uniref:MerR family transcriptional regulator n=1 Tax=Bosea sp. F3-2 TaxID=2599640 RepID=UPI0011EE090E|nr:MerR family transcriptional regulator [Bosea sp. F3-2]QEL27260.1 MerR family transcriptional regulator [Bosea sp. F3-2]
MTSRRQTIRYISTEFTPAEAARATGVSVELQRDWKRRGYLASREDGKHSRYTFEDLSRMLALKSFSDAGIGLRVATTPLGSDGFRNAETAASMAMLPMLGFANYAIRTTDPSHRIGRYVIVDSAGVCRTDSLDDYERERGMLQTGGPVAIIFDCKKAAEAILAKLDRPHLIVETSISDK